MENPLLKLLQSKPVSAETHEDQHGNVDSVSITLENGEVVCISAALEDSYLYID